MAGHGTNHFTDHSYDRHVPLELFGAAFIPGTYHGLVAPADLAVKLSSLLRINRPSAAVGRALTEVLKPEGVVLGKQHSYEYSGNGRRPSSSR